jgi:elongator complex protein 5
VEPRFGLGALPEGALVSLSNSKGGMDGEKGAVVIKAELRRRSGRSIIDSFVLLPPLLSPPTKNPEPEIILLDEHPLYLTPEVLVQGPSQDGEEVETTFNLGLTEKQKRDREGVVLPYFDAQKDGGAQGAGDGGRILYDMGVEDREDFDDEEDEI